jgi:hypothetical protein
MRTKMYLTNKSKIIPFPGVSFNPGDGIRITLEDSLKETRYTEDKAAPKVRGSPQSDISQNEIENFLREMGYVE